MEGSKSVSSSQSETVRSRITGGLRPLAARYKPKQGTVPSSKGAVEQNEETVVSVDGLKTNSDSSGINKQSLTRKEAHSFICQPSKADIGKSKLNFAKAKPSQGLSKQVTVPSKVTVEVNRETSVSEVCNPTGQNLDTRESSLNLSDTSGCTTQPQAHQETTPDSVICQPLVDIGQSVQPLELTNQASSGPDSDICLAKADIGQSDLNGSTPTGDSHSHEVGRSTSRRKSLRRKRKKKVGLESTAERCGPNSSSSVQVDTVEGLPLYESIVQELEHKLTTEIFSNEKVSSGSIESIRRSLAMVKSLTSKLISENKTLWCMLDSNRLTQRVPEVSRPNTIPTYANMLRKGLGAVTKNPIQVPKALDEQRPKTIVIKQRKIDTKETKSSLLSKVLGIIKPRENLMKIDRLQVQPKIGTVVVQCADKATFNKISTDKSLKAEAKVSSRKRRKPQIMISGVSTTIDKASLVEAVKLQNFNSKDQSMDADLKPLYKSGPKSRPLCNWVIAVSPRLRSKLIDKQYVYIDHMRCRISDHTSPVQCYKCYRFGHFATKCKMKTDICSHCNSTSHTYTTCPNKNLEPSCVNCCRAKAEVYKGHSAITKTCPVYRRHMKILIEQTNYGFSNSE